MRQCLQSPVPFAQSGRLPPLMIIRTNLIVLFRTLVFFGNFFNCMDIYWQSVSEVMGWNVHVCKALARMCVCGRRTYLELEGSRNIANDNSESAQTALFICSLVDRYRELSANAPRQGARATTARSRYISTTIARWTELLRDLLRRDELTDPGTWFDAPHLPSNADWLLSHPESVIFPHGHRARSRSRSPQASARRSQHPRSPLRRPLALYQAD